jgi:hypothetical protein
MKRYIPREECQYTLLACRDIVREGTRRDLHPPEAKGGLLNEIGSPYN